MAGCFRTLGTEGMTTRIRDILSHAMTLLAAVGSAAQPERDRAVHGALELARRYHGCGALDPAAILCREVLRIQPDTPEAISILNGVEHDRAFWRTASISSQPAGRTLTTFSFPIYGNPVAVRHMVDTQPEFLCAVQAFSFLQNGWGMCRWMGIPVLKFPNDLMLYQEMIFEIKPDLIIETGTYNGGSAFFLAHLLDIIGHGRIVTVDVEALPDRPQHPRITYQTGSSIDPAIVDPLRAEAEGKRVLVSLDSSHLASHVLAEMRIYADLVSVGSYMVVEDSNINGHPVWPNYTEPPNSEVSGPMEAIRRFVDERGDFVIDAMKHRLLVTNNPNGYLKRLG